MEKSLASLGDVFPDQNLECAISGCRSLCLDKGAGASPEGLPEPSCVKCRKLFIELTDQLVPCARPDCRQTWTWSRLDQLSAHRQAEELGRNVVVPRRFCRSCREQAGQLGDLKVKCGVEECQNTWTWPAEQRLVSESEEPPARLCKRCENYLRQLRDRRINCSMDGCSRQWTWTARNQLSTMIEAGASRPPAPPRKLCEHCEDRLVKLQDREIRCRIAGCRQTWKLTAEAQLRHLLIHGTEPDPAVNLQMMCDRCHTFLQQAKPRQVPCRIRGCPNTWTHNPSRQLHDLVRGRKHPPPLLCDQCQNQLRQMEPISRPCSTTGCRGSWSLSPEEQLREAYRRNDRRQTGHQLEKRCAECEQFLHAHTAQKLDCPECGSEIIWSAYEQLLYHHGTFRKPSLCANCSSRAATREQTKPEDFIHHNDQRVFRVPVHGNWRKYPRIADRPAGLDQAAMERLQAADLRILAFGDEKTTESAPGWPARLETILNLRLRDSAIEVAVANCGISGCNSRLAQLRLDRDVTPFKPDLVIVSFVFADAFQAYDPETKEGIRKPVDEPGLAAAEQALLRQLLKLPGRLLYWLPNPIFPQQQLAAGDPENKRLWANALDSRYRQTRARIAHLCQEQQVTILDVGSRFEINGRRSAQKWMSDPFFANPSGIRNIANWMAETILHHKLLPVELESTDA